MSSLFENFTGTDIHHLNILLLVGLAIFFATVGARLFQKLHIPKIVGYLVIGIIIGPIAHIITPETVEKLELFNIFALGVIGFLIGGELKKDVFTRLGKQVFYVLFFEGMTAFLLVGIFSFVVMMYFFGWQHAVAVAVVFGAICSATDPASTVSVLWECKARGPLTTMLTAIVALDDALAMMLYAISVSIAGVITGEGGEGFLAAITSSFMEIFGSVVIGVIAGVVLNKVLKWIDDAEQTLVFTFSFALLIIGIAITFHLDVILASMTLGLTLTNTNNRRAEDCFKHMHQLSAPIYVLFFVLAGARLNISHVNTVIILLTAAYVVGSIVGKTLGSYIGAIVSNSVPTIRKYLGFCLYPQGGIAVALLIIASSRFNHELASIMLLVVIAGALILQLIGPIFVKVGAHWAGELGLNVTAEDLIKIHTTSEMMDKNVTAINAGTQLGQLLQIISSTADNFYPVLNDENKPIGSITLNGIRNAISSQEINDWLVALDIMEPVHGTIDEKSMLTEALEKMKQLDVDFLLVCTADNRYAGILDNRKVIRHIDAEVLAKQKEADRMYDLKAHQTH
ncbi:MAG: cation:proton antiporter [Sedimentisphaerales bacterium]|nr:cation:proton antiporter [Sedimentisphaerales bacterium]